VCSSFRFLQTLYNLGPAPEPNLTIWYSPRLPDGFRSFASRVAIDTSSIQFESDEIMRRSWGDDGAIACCVSPMLVGKQMQFFGARANLAKCLLYAINGGRDELTGEQVGPAGRAVEGEYLDFDDVLDRFERMMDWLASFYVNAMNVIHYMHDKYAYERLEMALHDYSPLRTMAFGMAGLSVVADSLSAIRHARVRVVRDENGLVTDYRIEGEFPQFGNNDNRVDQLATWVVRTFMGKLRKYPTYRNALHDAMDHPEKYPQLTIRVSGYAELRAAHARAADGRHQPHVSRRADMNEAVPLEAKSPFELRVDLGKNVPEPDVRAALASGEMGFLHSFTTGSTVDGPGVRVVAWTTGCHWRCSYCHNPDTWTISNGIPVTLSRATEELRKYRHGLNFTETRSITWRHRTRSCAPSCSEAWERPSSAGAARPPRPSSRRGSEAGSSTTRGSRSVFAGRPDTSP